MKLSFLSATAVLLLAGCQGTGNQFILLGEGTIATGGRSFAQPERARPIRS